MRITINLATRPFVELKPVYARLRLVMALLALVAVGLGAWLYVASKRERAARDQMDALVRQTEGFQQERGQNETRMRQPQNRAVLERAQFLNGVFAQKAFSWTAVMMDLEQMLPAGVQVTSIQPSVAADGTVSIHLRVSGPRELQVNLMRNLEHSKRFLQPRLVNESAQLQDNGRVPAAQTGVTGVTGGVQFDILSGYNPLPVVKPEKKTAPSDKSTSAGGPLMPVPRAGPKKIDASGAPAGPNAKRVVPAAGAMPAARGQLVPPKNQVAQPARPPVSGGGR
jgi:type IV pilus assembly protein PilN